MCCNMVSVAQLRAFFVNQSHIIQVSEASVWETQTSSINKRVEMKWIRNVRIRMAGNVLYVCQYAFECAVVLVDICSWFGNLIFRRKIKLTSCSRGVSQENEFSHPNPFTFWLYPIHKRLFREPQRILFQGQFSGAQLNYLSTFSHFQHSHECHICCWS